MNIKKISLIWLFLIPFNSVYALDYRLDGWNFKLDADGMVGFLTPKNETAIFIDDWDVKVQASYNFNRTQRFGMVYSIDADCVEVTVRGRYCDATITLYRYLITESCFEAAVISVLERDFLRYVVFRRDSADLHRFYGCIRVQLIA